MELLNMLDTAAYSVQLSSFVSMSSPQDHHSHCQFLSAIFRHLVQSQLFNTRACWWSPVCVETSEGHCWYVALVTYPWQQNSPIKTAGYSSLLYLLIPASSGSWPKYFKLISGLCRSLNKDWGRLLSCIQLHLLDDWMRLHSTWKIFTFLLTRTMWT